MKHQSCEEKFFGGGYLISDGANTVNAKYRASSVTLFFLLHAGCLAVFFVPFRWSYVGLAAALYFLRMFAVTAGYHRYFSHRTYKLARVPQFLLAFLAETSGQKGVLWWAAHHREHHMYSDTPQDVHSPVQRGFWWAHMGWILSDGYDDHDPNLIRDYGKFPELSYFVLALITMGEGWHNNHHKFMYACRQGLCWWEVDCTYYVVKVLGWLGIAREIREPKLVVDEAGEPEMAEAVAG